MLKSLPKKQLGLLVGQHVLVMYKEGQTEENAITSVFKRVIKIDETGVILELEAGSQTILTPSIRDLSWKNVFFINPKDEVRTDEDPTEKNNELDLQIDKLHTQIIEKMKQLPSYCLSTRSGQFTKSSFSKKIRKKKKSRDEFELEVFNWIQKRKDPIKLHPLALLNKELLLVLYEEHFLLFKKNFSMVFDTEHHDINTIVSFIFEQNSQIKEKLNEKNNAERAKFPLRFLAEDLL